jgi:hypothetical protein
MENLSKKDFETQIKAFNDIMKTVDAAAKWRDEVRETDNFILATMLEYSKKMQETKNKQKKIMFLQAIISVVQIIICITFVLIKLFV